MFIFLFHILGSTNFIHSRIKTIVKGMMKIMKKRKITKTFAVALSLVLLQMTSTNISFLSSAVNAESISATKSEVLTSETSEISDEALSLDALPNDLYNDLQADLQNVTRLDESTYSDLFTIQTVNNDGTKSIMSFDNPIKYYDEETQSIRFIENGIVPVAGDEKVAFESQGNGYDVDFPSSISDGITFSENDYSIRMTPCTIATSANPQVVDKELVYSDVFGNNTDVHYELENSGIKESIVVDAPTGESTYNFNISVSGMVPESNVGTSIRFLDEETGELAFVIQPTFIADSYTGEYIDGEEHISYNNSYELEYLSDGSYLLHMYLDEEFLNAESTVYPCVIDPSIWAVNCTRFNSSYVLQSGGTGCVNNELSAGGFNGSGEHLSYVKATEMDKFRWIEPKRLQSASFRVKAASSGYTNTCVIDCYDSTTTTDVSEVTYSELTSSLGAKQSSVTFTTLGDTYSFDITNLVKSWITYELGEGGKDPAYGFILRGASGQSTPGRIFSSTNTSDTYLYIVYQEGEEIEDGFYNIKNVSTGTYLRYNNGNQLYMSSSPSLNACKWQIILSKDANASYGVYTIRPYYNLNSAMKGTTTNESVTTDASGNTFRIIRNADGTFRIMPAGSSYARVSNAIGVNSNYASIYEYANDDMLKWTFEPVVNKYFSAYSPDNFNDTTSTFPTQYRMNCYGYAFCNMLYYDLYDDYAALYPKYPYYKQQPGEFATTANKANVKRNIIYYDPVTSMDNVVYNMKLDASRLGYSMTEYTPTGTSVGQYGANSRLIAVATGDTDYHFYMQHNDGSWSHKPGQGSVTNCSISSTQSNPVYLTNDNIQQLANQGLYSGGELKFFIITRDAVADHPHGIANDTTQSTLYNKDIAGDFMFTSATLSVGTKQACFDYYDDVDYYAFTPSSTKTYTLSTTCSSSFDIDGMIYDCNGNKIVSATNAGQINVTFSATSGKRYFIKIYNFRHLPGEYALTLS